jgi:hypothetical protein
MNNPIIQSVPKTSHSWISEQERYLISLVIEKSKGGHGDMHMSAEYHTPLFSPPSFPDKKFFLGAIEELTLELGLTPEINSKGYSAFISEEHNIRVYFNKDFSIMHGTDIRIGVETISPFENREDLEALTRNGFPLILKVFNKVNNFMFEMKDSLDNYIRTAESVIYPQLVK